MSTGRTDAQAVSWAVRARRAQLAWTELTTYAAAAALFLLLATVPAVGAMVACYALIANPGEIVAHTAWLSEAVPHAVLHFVVGQLQRAAATSTGTLGLAMASSIALALLSFRSAMRVMLLGIRRAYGGGLPEPRRIKLSAMVAGSAFVLAVMLSAMICIVFVPALGAWLGKLDTTARLLTYLRWPAALGLAFVLYAGLYRFAGGAPIAIGAAAGALLWLASSWGLSRWVMTVADYEVLYGAFGSVVVTILWYYLSSLALLVGAATNAWWLVRRSR